MSKCAQRRARSVARISSKYAGARQRRQDREPRLKQLVPLDEGPQPFEVRLAPRRIDDEVAGHAVAECAARRRCPRAVSSTVASLRQARRVPRRWPPRGRRRCRTPARAAATPRAARDAARPGRRGSGPGSSACGCPGAELVRQREAARRVMPEQIVGDEDVVADRREVAADRVDRSLADRARVQLPDRAERAAERAASRGLDQTRPDGARDRRTDAATARRDDAPAAAPRRATSVPVSPAVRTTPPSPSRRASPGTVVERRAALERRRRWRGIARSPSSSTTAVDVRRRETAPDRPRRCVRRRRSARPATAHARARRARALRRSRARASRRCRRGRDARRADVAFERAAEAEVGERDAVAARFERGGDVLHAERLDAEERTEPESFVPGNGPQQQNVHGKLGQN